MDQPRPLVHLFSVFSNKQYNLQQINAKNAAGIRTTNLSNMSCHP